MGIFVAAPIDKTFDHAYREARTSCRQWICFFSISIAMSDVEDYSGGCIHLQTDDALFKVPRRSAIVFLSESSHAITNILSGERKVFVVELWEDEDTPIGLPRPDSNNSMNIRKSDRNSCL